MRHIDMSSVLIEMEVSQSSGYHDESPHNKDYNIKIYWGLHWGLCILGN